MNENNEFENQPAHENLEQHENQVHEPALTEDAPPLLDPIPDKKSEKPELKAEKQPPTRFQKLLRKILIGLVIVAVIFLAGILTDHFVRYQPLSAELVETQAELEDARQALSDLEEENDRLTSVNRTAADEIATLEAELSAVRANALFYQVLVDVNTARIALFLEDIEGAQAALANTQDNLEALLPAITDVNPDLALSLPRRLDLIVSGLERDNETGRIDLELFIKDLLELEPMLTGD